MGTLRSIASGRRAALGALHLVGRAPHCQLQLDGERVSATHTELRWSGVGWVARDMNSTNGTAVNGILLKRHQLSDLEAGDILSFGGDERWELVEAGPPRAAAHRPGGPSASAEPSGILSLPDAESADCQVFLCDGQWTIEQDGQQRPAADQQALSVNGQLWTLELPPGHDPFARTVPAHDSAEKARTFADVTLHFSLSRDMEFIGLEIEDGDWRQDLGGRVFNETLYVLARMRLPQTGAGPGDGWISVESLLRKAALDDARQLNQYVFHARRQLERLGVANASQLVGRRRVADDSGMRNELRLGTNRVRISQP